MWYHLVPRIRGLRGVAPRSTLRAMTGHLVASRDAARYLGLSAATLRNWRWRGRGPRFVKIGGPRGRVAYRPEDLDAYVQSRLRGTTDAPGSGDPHTPASQER